MKDFAVVADIISEKLFKERPMLSDVQFEALAARYIDTILSLIHISF